MEEQKKISAFWRKWLEKYKSFNCLWKRTSQTKDKQADRQERLRAWNELIAMAKTVNANANALFVQALLRKYIHKYKLKAKKIEVAKSNGISYKPKNYYYDIFKSIHEANETVIDSEPENRSVHQRHWRKVLNQYFFYKRLWERNSCTSKEQLLHWKKLTKMARVCYPKATVNFLKTRIRNCRTIYKKEKRKLSIAEKNGLGYKPKLFYYDIFDLLQEGEALIMENLDDSKQTDEELWTDNEDGKREKNLKYDSVTDGRLIGDKKVWRKLLKRYVTYKCLWDMEAPGAYSNVERNAAWQELLEIFQTAKPDADLALLKRRINYSRSTVKREFNKATDKKEHGTEYKSKLFYYDILSVLFQKARATTLKFSSDESSDENEIGNQGPDLQALEAELKAKDLIYAPLNSNPKHFERKIWLEVIKKYIYCDCLWNVENRDYYNADERHHAWHTLTEIAKKNNPNADLDFVKKRIKSCRTAYARQLKLAQAAKAKGEDYEIKLFYFNTLSPIYQKNFPILNYDKDDVTLDKNALDCKNTLNPISNTYYPDDLSSNESSEHETQDNYDSFECRTEKEEMMEFSTKTSKGFQENIEYKPTKNDADEFENQICFEPEVMIQQTSKNYVRNQRGNAFATFEEKIAQHLECMDETQYFLAEKFISDVCISGRHKELTRKSCIVLAKRTCQ